MRSTSSRVFVRSSSSAAARGDALLDALDCGRALFDIKLAGRESRRKVVGVGRRGRLGAPPPAAELALALLDLGLRRGEGTLALGEYPLPLLERALLLVEECGSGGERAVPLVELSAALFELRGPAFGGLSGLVEGCAPSLESFLAGREIARPLREALVLGGMVPLRLGETLLACLELGQQALSTFEVLQARVELGRLRGNDRDLGLDLAARPLQL